MRFDAATASGPVSCCVGGDSCEAFILCAAALFHETDDVILLNCEPRLANISYQDHCPAAALDVSPISCSMELTTVSRSPLVIMV